MLINLSSSQAVNPVTVTAQFNAELLAVVCTWFHQHASFNYDLFWRQYLLFVDLFIYVRQWWTCGRLYRARCSDITTARVDLAPFQFTSATLVIILCWFPWSVFEAFHKQARYSSSSSFLFDLDENRSDNTSILYKSHRHTATLSVMP